jgi:chorismate synthase
VAVLEGLPAGVPLTTKDVAAELARRRLGYGRGKRMRFEEDRVEILGGLRHGRTLGSPLAIMIANTEWPKWTEVMAADPVGDPEALSGGRGAPLTRPRPGHADLVGMQKYGFSEARPVLERASARETAARVAVGTAAKALLAEAGVSVLSHVVRLGPVQTRSRAVPGAADLEEIDASPVRCLDGEAEGRMVAAIDAARAAGDTLGGVFEVVAHGLPPGLGSHVHWDRKLDARLAGALMGIQAIKGVEVGEGFAGAAKPGSRAHDAIVPGQGGRPRRRTGRSGGIEGGMSTGETLRVRAAMKPLSTLVKALDTVDLQTGGKATANVQRSDVTALPAAAVVGESVVALVLADALLEKTGGDSLEEVRRNLEAYLAGLWTAPEG